MSEPPKCNSEGSKQTAVCEKFLTPISFLSVKEWTEGLADAVSSYGKVSDLAVCWKT